jgi:hypothetical protein
MKGVSCGKGGAAKGRAVKGAAKGGTGLMADLASVNSPADVLRALERARATAKPLKMVEASMSAHRLGKYGCSPEGPVVEWFFGELHVQVGIMGARKIANTASGLAKMRVPPSHPLWGNVVRRSLQLKARDFEPQAIANLMWAFATADVPLDAALVRDVVGSRIEEQGLQAAGNCQPGVGPCDPGRAT